MADELTASVAAIIKNQATTKYDGDAFWILFCGFLVFFMNAGFALLEAGSIPYKDKVNILFKNVGTVAFGGIAYFLLGYGLAYGSPSDSSSVTTFAGANKFAGVDFSQSFELDTNDRRDFFFQFAFCVTGATITSGAVAGRIKIEAYLILCVVIVAVVYPIVSHAAWSTFGFISAFKTNADDFLFADVYEFACGAFDYAGSGVVHMTGGVSAFWAAAILGPRFGRFQKDAEGKTTITPMPGHNMSIATLGTFFLWFGWYGFNCGSALLFDGVNVGHVAVTTSLAPAAAALTSIVLQKYRTGLYDLAAALNCILGGLVGVTAGCATVSQWGAIAIGVVSAFIYVYAAEMLLKIGVDDPIGAIPVHGCCGTWGVIAVGIFATPELVATAYSCPNPPPPGSGDWLDVLPGYQMLAQLVFVLFIIAWVSATIIPTMFALKYAGILRVPDNEQVEGLDKSEHFAKDLFLNNLEKDAMRGEKEVIPGVVKADGSPADVEAMI